MNKASYYLVLFVGTLTCLSFLPHAFGGMGAVLEHIAKGEIQEPAANGMQMIWLYSSIMMLLSGIWILFLSKPIKNGDAKARLQILLLGIGLSIFGLACTYISSKIDTMFLFTIQGIILILASTIFFKTKNNE
jgi:cytochrome bd-type quinol oxidase subunit 2